MTTEELDEIREEESTDVMEVGVDEEAAAEVDESDDLDLIELEQHSKSDPTSRASALKRIQEFHAIEDRKIAAGLRKTYVPIQNGYKEVWV